LCYLLQQQQYTIIETINTMAQNGKTVPKTIPNKAPLDRTYLI